jgi:hypothetical protein
MQYVVFCPKVEQNGPQRQNVLFFWSGSRKDLQFSLTGKLPAGISASARSEAVERHGVRLNGRMQ